MRFVPPHPNASWHGFWAYIVPLSACLRTVLTHRQASLHPDAENGDPTGQPNVYFLGTTCAFIDIEQAIVNPELNRVERLPRQATCKALPLLLLMLKARSRLRSCLYLWIKGMRSFWCHHPLGINQSAVGEIIYRDFSKRSWMLSKPPLDMIRITSPGWDDRDRSSIIVSVSSKWVASSPLDFRSATN